MNRKLFNDPQDFVDHLGSIRNNISNSLMIYNNITIALSLSSSFWFFPKLVEFAF